MTGLDELIVVTAEPRAAAAAREAGAHVVDDPVEAGQSDAAARGVDAAVERGAERGAARARRLPGARCRPRCARCSPGSAAPDVVIVPDRHGSGTNALRLTPPDVIAPSFGPGSFARHAARGAAAGAVVRVAQAPSLELDVDTPGDLAALRAALQRLPDAAPRTRALLERLAPRAAVG